MLCTCLLLVACSDNPHDTAVRIERIAVPAAAPAMGPRLSGDDELGLVLSWMEPGERSTELRYASFQGDEWSEAATIAEVERMFVNWADMPSVLPLGGDRLAAHWLQKSADLTYAYDVVFVQSADGGASWSEPVRPHSDGTPTEHGFVSLYPHGDDTGLIWLDGRETINEGADDPAVNGMTLRGASITPAASLGNEQIIDELTCDCCQTDVAIAASGPIAVYRDRSVNEIRDIYVTRSIDGRWQTGTRIAADDWEIPGCPVNGPSIDANGEVVAVVWYTAASDRPVVKLAWSKDSGEHFSAPVEVAAENTKGRVGVVLLDDHTAAVSWLGVDESGGHPVQVRRVDRGGGLGRVISVSDTAATLAVPQLAKSGTDLLFVWTNVVESQTHVESAIVPITAL